MHVKTLVSVSALAAALAFAVPAQAQTMMNGVEIPAESLAEVQAHCETLSAPAAAELIDNEDSDNAGDSDEDGGPVDSGTDEGSSTEGDSSDAPGSSEFNMSMVTLEACQEAGLTE